MNILTWVIWTLFGLLWVAELIAHILHNKYGKTISTQVHSWEKGHLYNHVLLGVLWLAFGIHLEFNLP